MTIRGVIFDLGDTLMYLDAEWEEVHAQNVTNLLAFLRTEGLELEPIALHETFHRRREEAHRIAQATRIEYPVQRVLRETLAELGHPNLDRRLLEQGIRALLRHEEDQWRAFPDAIPTLEALDRTGYRLGLISNASDDGMIQRLVDKLGIKPYLRPALNSAGVGIRKPDPQIFQIVLREWGLGPAEVVMVGDTPLSDILGAQLTGMRAILALMDGATSLVEQTGNPASDRASHGEIIPDATIEALAQLPSLLAAWQEEN